MFTCSVISRYAASSLWLVVGLTIIVSVIADISQSNARTAVATLIDMQFRAVQAQVKVIHSRPMWLPPT